MNIFIIFVKFLGWIVSIWVKLDRLIRKKRGPTTKMKYIITDNKKNGPRSLGPHLGLSLIQILKKKIDLTSLLFYIFIYIYIYIYRERERGIHVNVIYII